MHPTSYSTTPPPAGPAGTVAKAMLHPKDGRATFLEHCDQLGRVTHNALLDNSKENQHNVTVYDNATPCVSVFAQAAGFSLCQQFTPEAARILACALNLAADYVEDLIALRQAETDERDNATSSETAVAP